MSEGPAQPPPGDPNAPWDYPADPGLPPPIYPGPHAGFPVAPGYPPPGYPGYPGYDPYRPVKPLGTNGKAVGALIAALIGLLFCGVPSVAGLVLGVIAMRETKRTGQDGYGLALAAAIIGGLVTAGLVLMILLWIGVVASGFSLV
ncbi:DUF4190 domain-containing protein [Mycobacterium sp. ITM-2016-00316]|uniref:DUF4190 domain-containing protein n=1 Tax=Mycobacterium sp. ITM-2016-00316 TaxID=2099695 RepID=UPI000CF98B4A|nr:DUF4190 domain-containing protein [Mycobacterium sp. ITM-2016-00316]WNG80681.1 DUF4190 domain-containing protein [Mycobacterium sp. ITM-2016-00316]